ncbi:MAG TPA: guanosine monophosphate reductase, partial [Legionellaceae bacterium]|nr:guanosine monophosphate reductase [Legionellaceae bacterium]
MREGLTFDDILLVPQFSTIKSRDEVDLSVNFGPFKFASPIIPANMKTVISFDMAQAVVDSGGLVILHRFENQLEQERKFYNIQHSGMFKPVAASIGVKEPDYLHWFFYSNCFILCIDIAHGDSLAALETIRAIRRMQDKWPVYLIAGNVATGEAAKRLFKEGVDAVKIGVGPGGNCSTRRVTGNGVPQLTAILDVNDVRNEDFPDRKIIADGGIRNSGDVVKALAAGADFTMLGQFFAGCDEAPGA